MTVVILCIGLLISPIFLPFIIVRVVGVGPIIGQTFPFPTPLTSLPELSPVLSIRAGSGLGPGWGQVVRLAACIPQPLLIVGHVQLILVLHLINPRELRHRETVEPKSLCGWIGTRGGGGGWWGSSLEDEGPPSIPEDHGAWEGGPSTDKSMGLERTTEGALAWLRAAAGGVPVLTEWGGAWAWRLACRVHQVQVTSVTGHVIGWKFTSGHWQILACGRKPPILRRMRGIGLQNSTLLGEKGLSELIHQKSGDKRPRNDQNQEETRSELPVLPGAVD